MMKKSIELLVEYDSWLRDYLKEKLSNKLYKRLRNFGEIFVNGNKVQRYYYLKVADVIVITYESENKTQWPVYPVLPKVLYENENFMVVYKPAPLLTIPTMSEPISLYQSIEYYYSIHNIEANISFINRLDKDTQGLVIVAKNRLSAYYLNKDKEKIERRYLALCHGHFMQKKGEIKTYIAKDETKRFVSDKGKYAITEYEVKEEYESISLVTFHLLTGRTHQIRVHSSYMGHPIVGDKLYGLQEEGTMYLCSYYVKFVDPLNQNKYEFEIEPEWKCLNEEN